MITEKVASLAESGMPFFDPALYPLPKIGSVLRHLFSLLIRIRTADFIATHVPLLTESIQAVDQIVACSDGKSH